MGLTPPPVGHGNNGDGPDTALATAQQWLTGWLPFLAARRDLLEQWLGEAAADSSQLHPELLRYADVLASTCTGAGSRPELTHLDFDLAIVDESGQIGVADALIPLVRALVQRSWSGTTISCRRSWTATWRPGASWRAIRSSKKR